MAIDTQQGYLRKTGKRMYIKTSLTKGSGKTGLDHKLNSAEFLHFWRLSDIGYCINPIVSNTETDHIHVQPRTVVCKEE